MPTAVIAANIPNGILIFESIPSLTCRFPRFLLQKSNRKPDCFLLLFFELPKLGDDWRVFANGLSAFEIEAWLVSIFHTEVLTTSLTIGENHLKVTTQIFTLLLCKLISDGKEVSFGLYPILFFHLCNVLYNLYKYFWDRWVIQRELHLKLQTAHKPFGRYFKIGINFWVGAYRARPTSVTIFIPHERVRYSPSRYTDSIKIRILWVQHYCEVNFRVSL